MPMPRAKVQGLGAHVSNMAGSARGYVFGSNSRNSKQNGVKPEPMMDDEDSSSGSDSDSDMSDGEGTENFLSKINAATAAKKTNTAVKRGGDIASAQTSGTNKTPMFKSEPTATVKKIKLEPTEDSKDTTSSSGSSSESDSEDEKPAKKPTGNAKKVSAPSSVDSSSESDDEDDEEQSGAKVAAQQSSKQSNTNAAKEDDTSSSDDSEDESEENQASKKTKVTATAKSKKDSKPAATVSKKAAESSSSESGSESDSGSDSESDSDKAQSSKTAGQTTKSTDDSSSEDTSSSDDEQAKPAKPVATKKSVNGTVTSKAKKAADDSDVEMADESFALVADSQPANGELPEEFIREGFQLRKASDDADVSEVLNMFKKAKREGKQIWYFTTPASVPVSVVEKMNFPMRNAQTGKAIVSHNGVGYGVDLGASGVPSTFKILVPAKNGSKYEMVDRGIDHTMHLTRITQLAATDFTAKPTAQVTAKPPRPQPAVLKKRYTPIGVPTPILPPLPPVLRQRGDVVMTDGPDAPEGNGSTSDKSKKRKAGSEEAAKTPLSEKKSKKAKTINSISADLTIPKSTPPSSTPTGTSKKSQAKAKSIAVTTPSSQVKSRPKSSAEVARTQTPVPLPKIPGLKR